MPARWQRTQWSPRGKLRGKATVLALLLSVAAVSAIAAADQLSLKTKLTESGFETVALRRTGQQHLFIFGQVEGRRRSCLVDTGWSFTTVSTNTASRLSETNVIRQLQLNRVCRANVPVRVNDMRVNGQPASYDVVLGADFLVRQQAIIDCGTDRLFLREHGEPVKLEPLLARAGWFEIALQKRKPYAFTIAAHISNHGTELLVDSGAMWSCLDKDFAALAGLRPLASLQRMAGPAATTQRPYKIARLTSWLLDAHEMPERNFAVLDLKDWGLGANGKLFPEIVGILGGAELKSWEAVIDCGNSKLWLRRKL